MIGFEPFEKRIMPRLPGAARPTVRDEIIQAMQKFCRKTKIWRETDKITTSASQPEIVAVPHGTALVELESARFNDMPVDPAAIYWLDENVSQWRSMTGDQVKWITQLEPDTFRIVPTATGTLDLSLILMPSDDAQSFPDWMAAHYTACIADGALGELMTIPGQEFTNPQLASFHMQKFMRRIDELKSETIKGQQKARIRTKPTFM